jgi:hypothetical protein
MSDLINRISFDDIARYLFTGLAICIGYLLYTETSPASLLEANKWATNIAPGSLVIAAVMFAGYITFQVYRGLLYPYIIIPLRTYISLSPKYKYLSKCAIKLKIPITPIKVENIYGVLRGKDLDDEYPTRFPSMATAIHIMYCSSFILVPCSIKSGYLFWIFASFLLLIAAGASDFSYERMEVDIFKRNKRLVNKALKSLKDKTKPK